jgi:uridine kinase
MLSDKVIIVGVSGASASGKSLLSNTIVNELGSGRVVVISEDAYYKHHPELSLEERAQINYDHPDAFDHDLLCQHLKLLQEHKGVSIPIYDFTTHLRSEQTKYVGPHDIIVLEGILLFVDKALREMMDISIFVDAPLDVCFIRRLKRDINERKRDLDSVIAQYENTVRPMYLQFIEPSKRYADIIVPKGGENRIAIDLIKAKMRELLK